MMKRSMMKCSAVLGVALALAVAIPASAKKKAEPLASVNFVVLRDENGKPVRNASVVLHPVGENGKQRQGGLELKTSAEGQASYDGVPYGKLRIQVLANGFQTFGQDYDIGKPNMDITIKLKRPAGQYSIYDTHPEDEKKPQQK